MRVLRVRVLGVRVLGVRVLGVRVLRVRVLGSYPDGLVPDLVQLGDPELHRFAFTRRRLLLVLFPGVFPRHGRPVNEAQRGCNTPQLHGYDYGYDYD